MQAPPSGGVFVWRLTTAGRCKGRPRLTCRRPSGLQRPKIRTAPPCLKRPTTPRPSSRRSPKSGRRPTPFAPAQGRRAGRRAVHHRHPAAERHRLAAYGPCAQQHAAGHPGPLRAHARQERAVAAGHGPRRHRHADGGRAPADGAADPPPRHRPRRIHREGLGVEGRIRRHDLQPAEAARRLLRLVARALHHGRGPVEGRPRGVRHALQGRADLQGQAAGELGSRSC